MRKHILIVLGLILLVIAAGVTYLAWPDKAQLPADAVTGKRPKIAEPRIQIIPTVDVAKVVGWQGNAAPTPAPAAPVAGNLSRISNVEMSLTVEIGRTRMAVRDLLALEPGAVVELDRSAGTPADILLNGKLIAHGDVVVVDQDYAVRITRILDNPEGPL